MKFSIKHVIFLIDLAITLANQYLVKLKDKRHGRALNEALRKMEEARQILEDEEGL